MTWAAQAMRLPVWWYQKISEGCGAEYPVSGDETVVHAMGGRRESVLMSWTTTAEVELGLHLRVPSRWMGFLHSSPKPTVPVRSFCARRFKEGLTQ